MLYYSLFHITEMQIYDQLVMQQWLYQKRCKTLWAGRLVVIGWCCGIEAFLIILVLKLVAQMISGPCAMTVSTRHQPLRQTAQYHTNLEWTGEETGRWVWKNVAAAEHHWKCLTWKSKKIPCFLQVLWWKEGAQASQKEIISSTNGMCSMLHLS